MKVEYLIILCIVLWACNGNSHNEELLQKIDSLNNTSYQHWYIDLDAAVYYAYQAKEAACEINYKEGIAESYNNLGFAYTFLSRYDSAIICFNYNIAKNKGLETALSHIGKANIAIRTCNHQDYYLNMDCADSILSSINTNASNSDRLYLTKSEQLITRIYYQYFTNDNIGENFKQDIKNLQQHPNAIYNNQNIILSYLLSTYEIKKGNPNEALSCIRRDSGASVNQNYLQVHLLNLVALLILSDSSALKSIQELNIPSVPKGANAFRTIATIYSTIISQSITYGGNLHRIVASYYKLGKLYNSANNFASGMQYLDSALLYINLHYELNHTNNADTIRMLRKAINQRKFIDKEPAFKIYDPSPIVIRDTFAMNASDAADRAFLFWMELIREQCLVACMGIPEENKRGKIFNYNYFIFQKLDTHVGHSGGIVHIKELHERKEDAKEQKRLWLISSAGLIAFIILFIVLYASRKERKRRKNLSLINHIGQDIIQSGKTSIISKSTPAQCIINKIFNDLKTLFPKINLLKIGLYRVEYQELLFYYHLQKNETVETGSESYFLNDIRYKDRAEVQCFLKSNKRPLSTNLKKVPPHYDKHINGAVAPQAKSNSNQDANMQSVLCLPLISNSDHLSIGVVAIQSYAPNAFGKYELLLLKSIIPYITIAIENRQLFDELVEVKKSEQLGYMARGISHEIGSSMGASRLSAIQLKKLIGKLNNLPSLTETEGDTLKKIEENTDFIINEIKTIARIMDSFKLLSRDNIQTEKKEFNVYEKLQDIIRSFSPLLQPKKINVRLKCPHILNIKSFPGEFSLVLGNLFKNSLQHGFAGRTSGNIDIIIQSHSDGTKLSIIYKDDGNGIAIESTSHIFDLSYTTNPNGSTGLGLNIVRQILTKIGGSIVFNPSATRGVEFIIELKLS